MQGDQENRSNRTTSCPVSKIQDTTCKPRGTQLTDSYSHNIEMSSESGTIPELELLTMPDRKIYRNPERHRNNNHRQTNESHQTPTPQRSRFFFTLGDVCAFGGANDCQRPPSKEIDWKSRTLQTLVATPNPTNKQNLHKMKLCFRA